MRLRRSNNFILRTVSASMLAFITAVFLLTIIFVTKRVGYTDQHIAVDGYLSLTDKSTSAEPVQLNGFWEVFDGVVCTSESDVQNLGVTNEQRHMPIGSMVEAKKDATYRLYFSLPNSVQEDLYLYIPNFYQSADIYLNGVKLSYMEDGKSWLPYSTIENILHLDNIVSENEWQELVITAPFKSNSTTLYKRAVYIGTMKNLSASAIFSSSNELLLFGLLVLVLLNGYVFMLFRPEHNIISLMTLFDTAILMRSALSMNYVVSFGKEIFPWLYVSDRLNCSLTLFFLMIGGFVGCKLSTAIYDPENKAPQWLIKPVPWIYIIFAVIFSLSPEFFEVYGRYLLIVVYVITFIGVFIQYLISLSVIERRTYNFLQLIKTIYIGVLVFIDILMWNTSSNLLLLFYLYSLFFILHVIVRLYDNNQSYRDVELLNESLEDTVDQRTKELSEANRVLSELSIKDPLTQIFNRLYFERSMEKVLLNFNPDIPVHLCIFDLDFFKNVNDTYGHNAGDEQLRSMCTMVSKEISEDVIFARIGGEEFVLLFSGFSTDDVITCLEHVRLIIDKDASINQKHTTASFGFSPFYPGDNIKQLMKRADQALYEAKRLGRNCIVANLDNELSLLTNLNNQLNQTL